MNEEEKKHLDELFELGKKADIFVQKLKQHIKQERAKVFEEVLVLIDEEIDCKWSKELIERIKQLELKENGNNTKN